MRNTRTPSALRSVAVLTLAALCLHQLVYLLTFGGHSGPVVEGSSHGYLAVAAPLLAGLAVSGIAATLAMAARRARGARETQPRGWLAWASLLLIIFVTQEAGEALLRTGSLEHLVALAETSGAAALLAAIGVGRLVGLALTGLSALEATLATPVRPRPRAPVNVRPPLPHSPLHFPRLALAFGFSRRPPPAFSA